MLKNSSVELKSLILFEFTRKLVIAQNPTPFLKELEIKKKTKKEKFIEKVKNKVFDKIDQPIEIAQAPVRVQAFQSPFKQPPQRLHIPETRLPPQFSYLRPYSKPDIELDLGKLNPLLADPATNVIEANGEGQDIIVRGRMGTMPVQINLTKEEINNVIKVFSEKSKIPVSEGAIKIVLGKYILSAIISEEAGSRFIIKKIPQVGQRQLMSRR